MKRKDLFLTLGSLAISSGCHAGAGTWSSTRTVEVADPQYQMTAFSIAVPAGWKYAGTVARDPGCHANGAALKQTMQTPDGQFALVVLPGFAWAWSTDPTMRDIMQKQHCAAIDIDSAAKFLVNIAVPNLYPNGKITAVLPLEAEGTASLGAQLEQRRQSAAQLAARYGKEPNKISLDGARVRVEYLFDGKLIEAQVLSVVDCFEIRSAAMFRQPASSRRSCSARNVQIVRTPKGHLEEFLANPQLATLNKAIHANQDWSARLAADQKAAFDKAQSDNDRLFRASLQNSKTQADIRYANGVAFQKGMQASTDASMQNARNTQNAIDNAAHRQVLESLNRQDFKDPSTGRTIEASNAYAHQWLSSDGSTLIQTDNPSLDPNGVVYPVSQSWTELTAK